MSIVGHVVRTRLYTFDDGEFSFHTAFQGVGMETSTVTFRSRMDTWPSITAANAGIEYKRLLGATDHEIAKWLEAHPQFRVKQVKEV